MVCRRTAEIVATQRWAAACGARTIAITNDGDSPLADAADLALVTLAGEERAVPATKSHTAQLTAVAVLIDALGPTVGRLDSGLASVPDEVGRLLATADGVAAAVEQLADVEQILVSGRGIAYGTALEVALKLEETCLDPVRGLSYPDLRHGPIAVVDCGVVAVLVAAGDGPILDGMTELAGDLARRRGLGPDAPRGLSKVTETDPG